MSASQVRHIYGEILAAGAVAGSYVVDRLAYQGGFASVYRAHHAHSREPAALKVLRRSLAESMRITLRFRQEAETMKRLHHPNIARVFEIGDLYDGRPYIAMDWLDGRNLAQELQARGAISAHEALGVMTELGSAVAAAHRLGIVHRDIKAANIIAVPQGEWFRPVLVDFGIAKLTSPDDMPAVITMHSIVGTPQSMAPEQILGRSVDARTDIYALGLLLYEMVTGRAAFAGDTAVEIEEMHLHAVPPSASLIAPVSPAFDRVVARALQKRKEDRYATVEELVSDLARAVAADARATPGSEPGVQHCQGIGVCVEVRTRAGSAGADGASARISARISARTSDRSGDTLTSPGREEASLCDAPQELPEGSGSHELAVAPATPVPGDTFAVMDELLDRADRALGRAGLVTVVESSNALLAARALPRPAREQMRVRLATLDRVLLLAAELAEIAEPAGLDVFIAVHVASVDVLGGRGRASVIGGELLRLGTWPGFEVQTKGNRWPPAAVAVTSAALAGLEEEFECTALNDRWDCWMVRVAR